MEELRKIVGDYVITGVKNAFNSKTSFWISKKGYTKALYCFSASTEREAKEQLKYADGYIRMFMKNVEWDEEGGRK